jgi:hypothetical protein
MLGAKRLELVSEMHADDFCLAAPADLQEITQARCMRKGGRAIISAVLWQALHSCARACTEEDKLA